MVDIYIDDRDRCRVIEKHVLINTCDQFFF